MLNQIHFFLYTQLKQKSSLLCDKNKGFTLIELLVAMIIAFLVITPLLGFMINVLDTDRKEQAKVYSEQETQVALDYISQDLQQAIYIYDAKGIKAIQSQLPHLNATDRTPVLVFWKRQFENQAINVQGSTKRNDSFVYSLVAYYLIKDDNTINDPQKIWSDQFRIARFEVKDGVRDPDNPIKSDGSPNYLPNKAPDKGFALFKITESGTLEEKMNLWKKKPNEDYDKKALELIDYIDGSNHTALQPVDCKTIFADKNTSSTTVSKKDALRVPAFEGMHQYSTLKQLNNGSFYACVDIDKNVAQVFIRGNALARISNQDNSYKENRKTYFPTVSTQVKAKGFIGVE